MRFVNRHHPTPTDDDALAALADAAYHEGMVGFGRALEELTGPVWKSQYASGRGVPAAPMPRP